MATNYFQDPFGAADYSAEGTRGLLDFLRDKYPRIYGAGSGLLQNTPYDTADAYSVFDPRRQAAFDAAQVAFPAGLALDLVPGVRALKQPAMQLGRAGERLAERVVPQIMDRGGMSAGLLDAFAPQPSFATAPKRKLPAKAPQEAALELAKINAAKTGQSLEPYPRSLQQGYEYDWYHGSTGDISNFRQDLLGETTGAQSAKKGFFFARDPQNPPASMMVKTIDPASIDMLKRLGKTDKEIAALNQVSMKGQGAETASGYARIGGSREYREAMRNAKSAEKRGDWNEYEKQMQIAEDFEINRMQEAQSLVAKYGDARDTMTEKVNQTFYSLQHPQAKAELLDKKYKELMPYGWYNSYSDTQFNNLKNEIVKLVGKDDAAQALKEIDKFKSIKNERTLLENTESGGNVMPVALRYKNPMVYDFGGSGYREQTYSDLVDQALRGGHDALILKNTFDPAAGQSKLIDVGVVFSPDQIRSKFAAFDPLRKDVATAAAMGVAAPNLLAAEPTPEELKRRQSAGLLSP